MQIDTNIRWGWLKFMYIYTIAGAGLLGLGIIVVPEFIKLVIGWPFTEPVSAGIVGSVYIAFGILSIFGLRSPLKFSPVLVLQLCYKTIWFIVVILRLLVNGGLPAYAITIAFVFATYIVGDLIAIPFSYIFAKPLEKTS
jgi:hypothetical protein